MCSSLPRGALFEVADACTEVDMVRFSVDDEGWDRLHTCSFRSGETFRMLTEVDVLDVVIGRKIVGELLLGIRANCATGVIESGCLAHGYLLFERSGLGCQDREGKAAHTKRAVAPPLFGVALDAPSERQVTGRDVVHTRDAEQRRAACLIDL